eukprot:3936606-Rhodomonas_salina.1
MQSGLQDISIEDACKQQTPPLPAEGSKNGPDSRRELYNALSMFPALVLGLHALDNPCSAWVGAGVVMLSPASVMLHLFAFLGRVADVVDNDLRRLDQTLQCVACPMVSFGLGGSVLSLVLSAVTACYAAVRVWDPECSNDGKRHVPICVAAFAAMTPLLEHGFFAVYAATLLVLTASSLCFHASTAGNLARVTSSALLQSLAENYGHAVFHLIFAASVALMSFGARLACSHKGC